jgi:hypothetical protein
METTYTVRSEGGSIKWSGSAIRTDAMDAAQRLAAENPGQRMWLLKNGQPVRSGHAFLTWTSGPRAEVQR